MSKMTFEQYVRKDLRFAAALEDLKNRLVLLSLGVTPEEVVEEWEHSGSLVGLAGQGVAGAKKPGRKSRAKPEEGGPAEQSTEE